MKHIKFYLLFFTIISLSACVNDTEYIPKPHGYFRINFPEKHYVKFDTNYPYSFEIPSYASIETDKSNKAEPYWLNIAIQKYNAKIYISYKKVNNLKELAKYIEDSRTFVIKHIPKSTGINDTLINEKDKKVYGLFYDILGTDAASPMQFFLTDSVNHFFRAALYFNNVPNNDSLEPVIQFIKQDISHLVKTFHWKKVK